jgi:general secretion pathway protein G
MSKPSHPDRNQPRRDRHRRGFTLLEVIVVVTIIALLAALVAPKVWQNIGKSKQKIAQAEVASIAQQVRLWMVDSEHSRIPEDFQLDMLVEGQTPYIDADDLLDPWGNPYVLVNPGEANPGDFDVVSFGADGQRGGAGEDADVVN